MQQPQQNAIALGRRLRSSFQIVKVTDDCVYLVDNDDGRMSVTNDAENVCKFIHASHPGKRIVYRDSMERWDELDHANGEFKGFLPRPLKPVPPDIW